MEAAKTIKFITECEALYIDELRDRLDITAEDKENGYIQDFFNCDPDYIKSNETDGRGQMPFVVITENDTTYIISDGELDEIELEIVQWWLDGAENELDIENNWNIWNKVNHGIAYRGGSGYSYTLYAKN